LNSEGKGNGFSGINSHGIHQGSLPEKPGEISRIEI
jgi:hypothetical protein